MLIVEEWKNFRNECKDSAKLYQYILNIPLYKIRKFWKNIDDDEKNLIYSLFDEINIKN